MPPTTPRKPSAKAKAGGSKPKLFQFKTSKDPSFKAKVGSFNGKSKMSKAVFSLVKAVIQKGDKAGQESGAIYARMKPKYGQNDTFKESILHDVLAEPIRWNDELKVYTVRVYTIKQATMILEKMRKLPGCDKDLPTEADESVFENAKPTEINIVPMLVHDGPTSQNQDMIALQGATYPFKDYIKGKGFTFHNTVNNMEGINVWLAPTAEVDTAELTAHFEKYGFTVDEHDGAEEEAIEEEE
jgi:hypothetical protein